METLIFRSNSPKKLEALKAVAKALEISFESEEKPYHPKFVTKIEKSKEDKKAGKGRVSSIDEIDSLWK
ncbi:DUF2683 family protein [Dyadobacter sp. 3J3]|uniref:DUF2683 family protein n=1 Tax=Dyadobacter sp. 3J3 TaxID=2606600 RepID=UPI00135CED20|nr:DUF2683 family protein [Dyadobacter sp. 3J3]